MARLVEGCSLRTVTDICLKYFIPTTMAGGIYNYFSNRIPAGDFLMAVLRNDLKEACARADEQNKHILWNYVNLFYNEAPSFNWGHEGKVKDWLARTEVS